MSFLGKSLQILLKLLLLLIAMVVISLIEFVLRNLLLIEKGILFIFIMLNLKRRKSYKKNILIRVNIA